MTRKSDKRRLPSLSFLPINILLPRPPQTRTSDFEMSNGVKSGVSFSHVHCYYGQAYITCTI